MKLEQISLDERYGELYIPTIIITVKIISGIKRNLTPQKKVQNESLYPKPGEIACGTMRYRRGKKLQRLGVFQEV